MTPGGEERLRVDLVLDRLCITRSRSEAKAACDAGAVLVDGQPARASREVGVGQTIEIRFPRRTLEVRLEGLPPRSTSRQAARTMYDILRDEHS